MEKLESIISLIENEFKEDVNLKEYFSDAWSHIERCRPPPAAAGPPSS